MDGVETKFVEGFFTIFGHGIAVGLGEALDSNPGSLRVMQGRNEQGMCHTAIAFAKQHNRRRIIACASSIGPGAANMVTACATATVNNIPLLVFPSDTFASRQPDPVLQQLEQSNSLATTTNDAFKPVCKYWDRVSRPEQVMTALINAMRVLTDPAETGACCIALPQDVEGESYDYPTYFFEKRVHRITRPVAVEEELDDLAAVLTQAKKPLLIVGGGVKYSEAGETVEQFCEEFHIPFGESQAGKSACRSSHPYCLGGIGVTGTLASNVIAKDADVVLAVGSRLSDFTTSSKHLFRQEGVRFLTINNNRYHAYKMDAVKAVGDAKVTLQALAQKLRDAHYVSAYQGEIEAAKAAWDQEWDRLADISYTGEGFEPIIKARDPRTIPEFVRLTGGVITQTARWLPSTAPSIRMRRSSRRAVRCPAACSGCGAPINVAGIMPIRLLLHGVRSRGNARCQIRGTGQRSLLRRGGFELPDASQRNHDHYAGTAEGQHSHFRQLRIWLHQQSGNEPRHRQSGDGIPLYRRTETHGRFDSVDYAKIGEGYGLKTYTCKTIPELVAALEDAKQQTIACLFDLKVLPKTMTDGYESWWNVGIATTSVKESVREACEGVMTGRKESRAY